MSLASQFRAAHTAHRQSQSTDRLDRIDRSSARADSLPITYLVERVNLLLTMPHRIDFTLQIVYAGRLIRCIANGCHFESSHIQWIRPLELFGCRESRPEIGICYFSTGFSSRCCMSIWDRAAWNGVATIRYKH